MSRRRQGGVLGRRRDQALFCGGLAHWLKSFGALAGLESVDPVLNGLELQFARLRTHSAIRNG